MSRDRRETNTRSRPVNIGWKYGYTIPTDPSYVLALCTDIMYTYIRILQSIRYPITRFIITNRYSSKLASLSNKVSIPLSRSWFPLLQIYPFEGNSGGRNSTDLAYCHTYHFAIVIRLNISKYTGKFEIITCQW